MVYSRLWKSFPEQLELLKHVNTEAAVNAAVLKHGDILDMLNVRIQER